MENTLFFYPSAASEPWELSHSVKPDITSGRQAVLICFMDFVDRRCSMTNRSVRCTNSISPNWHLCWVWRDACCWNCWNAFEMDPMISLWDHPWDPPIVWDLGERARSRMWRREENHPLSFTIRSVISERASRSSDDLGFHLKRQPITYGFGYRTTDSRKCAAPHTKMGFEWEMRAVFSVRWRIKLSLSVSIMPEDRSSLTQYSLWKHYVITANWDPIS